MNYNVATKSSVVKYVTHKYVKVPTLCVSKHWQFEFLQFTSKMIPLLFPEINRAN